MNKILTLFFILLISSMPIATAMTLEQQQGYELEEAIGQYLQRTADITHTSGYGASQFADDLIRKGYSSKEVLIKGGSLGSKYAPRDFARRFIKNFRHTPDFIKVKGNTITIIESKLSGTTTNEQINALNQLTSAMERKGFTVNREISCLSSSKCKIPSKWVSRTSRVKVGGVGLKFIRVINWIALGLIVLDLMEASYEHHRVNCYNGIIDGTPFKIKTKYGMDISIKECFCRYGNERITCCDGVLDEKYNILDMMADNNLCKEDYNYKLNKCVEYKTGYKMSYDVTDPKYYKNKKELTAECQELISKATKATPRTIRKGGTVRYADSSYKKEATRRCFNGDVYGYDSNNKRGNKIRDCKKYGDTCVNGDCISKSSAKKTVKKEVSKRRCLFGIFCW